MSEKHDPSTLRVQVYTNKYTLVLLQVYARGYVRSLTLLEAKRNGQQLSESVAYASVTAVQSKCTVCDRVELIIVFLSHRQRQ